MQEIWKDIEGYEGFYQVSNRYYENKSPINATVIDGRVIHNDN